MASLKAKENKRQSSLYENSLPQGCQVIELSHISTNAYDSLRREDAAETDNGGQYETVCVNTTGNNLSPQALNRNEESARQGTMLRSMDAHPGRMIIVAVAGVLVLTVIGMIISGVIVYNTLNAKIEEMERERQSQYAEDNTNNRLETLDNLVQELNNRSDTSMESVQLEINDVKAEFSSFQNIWSKEVVSLHANDSNARDTINDTNTRLETLGNLVQELKKDTGTFLHEPVVFNAYLTGLDIDPVVGQAIIFNRQLQNYGNAYNSIDGKFTPPVAGVYHFSVQICMSKQDEVAIQIVSTTRVYAASKYREDYDATCYSVSTVAVLAQLEKVWVKCVVLTKYAASYTKAIEADTPDKFRTMFNGYLVRTIL